MSIFWKTVFLTAMIGCGGDGSGRSAGVTSKIIPLKGVSYLHPPSGHFCLDSQSASLHALGDINEDGYTDFVIAASGQGRESSIDRGWIEVYSGKDGEVIWNIRGLGDDEARQQGEDKAYHFEDIAVLDDLTGDGVPEIYCREAYYKDTVFLFSGRDGSCLGRHPVAKTGFFARPLFCQDIDDDGISEIVFLAKEGNSIGLDARSSVDLSPSLKKSHLWPPADGLESAWLVAEFGDVDGDGSEDHLLRRGLKQSFEDPVFTYEFAFLSGKDWSIIRTFETPRPRTTGTDHHNAAGDLNGDGIGDILMTSTVGEGPQRQTSSLRAISGEDGSIIWTVLGTQLQGGATLHLIDAQTGEQSQLEPDVRFDGPVLSIPDFNGDSVNDVATVAFGPGGQGSRRTLLLFSGIDGVPLASVAISRDQGQLHDSLILLDAVTANHRPGIAVSGRSSPDDSLIAVFELSANR